MVTNIQDMQVVILCGGQGTRIRAVAEDRPKPMVEVGEKPILWHIMKIYASYGVRRFVLALGHQGQVIVDFFANYQLRNRNLTLNTRDSSARLFHPDSEGSDIEDWEITMVHTGVNTMTGGRIKRVAPYLHGDTFFATYGDGVSTVDIRALLEFHRSHGRTATMTGVHLPTTFGVVESLPDGSIKKFREKPTMDGYINGGFFVLNRDILDEIDGDSTILEDKPFHQLVEKEQLRMFRFDGFWHAMDHYKDYTTLNDMWAKGNAPWKVW
jgi:glucose-1-phosphate cytidylyltransferase